MKKLIKYFLSTMITTAISFGGGLDLFAQIGDGTNFDFSMGDYTYWKGYQSKNTSTATNVTFINWVVYTNPSECTWSGSLPAPAPGDTCFIINKNYSEFDLNVGATKLIKIPTYFGFNRSTTINVKKPGANTNMLSYDMLVAEKNSLVTFNFSMVLEAPGHSGYQNPFFQLEIFELDENDNEIARLDPTTYYEVIGQLPAPDGWSTFTISGADGIWQNWKQISFNLANFRTKRIRMKVLVAGCSPTGHWSYGYFVGKVGYSKCQVNSCYNADTVAKLIAPSGFAKYEWFANPNDLPESQLSSIATGIPIMESHVIGSVPAKNSFLIKYSTHANYGDNYFVRLTTQTSTSTPGSVSYIKVKAFNSKPKARFYKQSGDSNLVTFYNDTEFPIQDTSALIEYFWDFGDGSEILMYNSQTYPIVENISPSHQYSEQGTYRVQLTAKYNGCATTYDTIIHATFIGLNEIYSEPSFSLYPNPATKQANLKIEGVNGKLQVSVIDEQGRIIKTIDLYTSDSKIEAIIDCSSYISGVYYIKIIGADINKVEKLIIE
ncbi:MAG: Protease 1 precursor [Bacteroidetes bacterium]|nr:Protease 1 precursor [Bacteroidota bacterium]